MVKEHFILRKEECAICHSKRKPLFSIPKDPKRMHIWLRNIQCEDWLKFHDSTYVHNNGKLCVRHFPKWAFSSTELKKLIAFAEPIRTSKAKSRSYMTLPKSPVIKDLLNNQQPEPIPTSNSTPRSYMTSPKSLVIIDLLNNEESEPMLTSNSKSCSSMTSPKSPVIEDLPNNEEPAAINSTPLRSSSKSTVSVQSSAQLAHKTVNVKDLKSSLSKLKTNNFSMKDKSLGGKQFKRIIQFEVSMPSKHEIQDMRLFIKLKEK